MLRGIIFDLLLLRDSPTAAAAFCIVSMYISTPSNGTTARKSSTLDAVVVPLQHLSMAWCIAVIAMLKIIGLTGSPWRIPFRNVMKVPWWPGNCILVVRSTYCERIEWAAVGSLSFNVCWRRRVWVTESKALVKSAVTRTAFMLSSLAFLMFVDEADCVFAALSLSAAKLVVVEGCLCCGSGTVEDYRGALKIMVSMVIGLNWDAVTVCPLGRATVFSFIHYPGTIFACHTAWMILHSCAFSGSLIA